MKHFLMTILLALLAVSAVAQSQSRVFIEDFELSPDSSIVVPVILANVERTRGVQFYITLPEGLMMEDFQLTKYSLDYRMTLSCPYSQKNGCYMVFIYPSTGSMFPPDTVAVMTFEFKASPTFEGGIMPIWKCRGSTVNNSTIIYQNDTTLVTVPTSSLIGIPMDNQPLKDQFFNLMGQPIDSPVSAPVAIQVTTLPNGERSTRKVAISY